MNILRPVASFQQINPMGPYNYKDICSCTILGTRQLCKTTGKLISDEKEKGEHPHVSQNIMTLSISGVIFNNFFSTVKI